MKHKFKVGQTVVITDGEATSLYGYTGKQVKITRLGKRDEPGVPGSLKHDEFFWFSDDRGHDYYCYFSCARPLTKLEKVLK